MKKLPDDVGKVLTALSVAIFTTLVLAVVFLGLFIILLTSPFKVELEGIISIRNGLVCGILALISFALCSSFVVSAVIITALKSLLDAYFEKKEEEQI